MIIQDQGAHRYDLDLPADLRVLPPNTFFQATPKGVMTILDSAGADGDSSGDESPLVDKPDEPSSSLGTVCQPSLLFAFAVFQAWQIGHIRIKMSLLLHRIADAYCQVPIVGLRRITQSAISLVLSLLALRFLDAGGRRVGA
jgi:hypothetical protein